MRNLELKVVQKANGFKAEYDDNFAIGSQELEARMEHASRSGEYELTLESDLLKNDVEFFAKYDANDPFTVGGKASIYGAELNFETGASSIKITWPFYYLMGGKFL